MDGPKIEVYGNVRDGVGNTMNSGEVVVHGFAGDVARYSMRSGRIYVRGRVDPESLGYGASITEMS